MNRITGMLAVGAIALSNNENDKHGGQYSERELAESLGSKELAGMTVE